MKFAAFIGVIALAIASAVFGGWVLTILWKWFIVTAFNVPTLGIAQGIGLSLTVGFLTKKYKPAESQSKKSFSENLTEGLIGAVIQPCLVLLFGWIVKMFL